MDGLGGPPLPDAAIAVRGNRILAVGPRAALLGGPDAAAAVPVDLGGGWVVPGLVDAHVHLATAPDRPGAEAELHRLLYGGVTAVRDMAGDARALASLARDALLGEIASPDIYYAALMAGPSFHSDPRPRSAAAGQAEGTAPWMRAVGPDTDLRLAVAEAKGTSATGVKIYADLEPSEVARIAAEARRQGLRVWAHSAVFPTRPLDVARAGVDAMSHACPLGWEAMAEIPEVYHHREGPRFSAFSPESRVFDDLFEEMRRRGTVLDATLAHHARADSARRAGAPLRGEPCDAGFARAIVGRAHAAGVAVAAGTDFVTPPSDPFPALHREVEELVHGAGLTPMAALEAATRVAAEAIGVDHLHGTIQPGRSVTWVLLAEDPLEDVRNLRSVRAVWRNAERFERSRYRPRFSTPG